MALDLLICLGCAGIPSPLWKGNLKWNQIQCPTLLERICSLICHCLEHCSSYHRHNSWFFFPSIFKIDQILDLRELKMMIQIQSNQTNRIVHSVLYVFSVASSHLGNAFPTFSWTKGWKVVFREWNLQYPWDCRAQSDAHSTALWKISYPPI